MTTARVSQTCDWWADAVVYEVYIRSFADGDGDGVGDIAGITARLDYLDQLGVDAIWITPWFDSPMADGGYDVADYTSIDPQFGSLDDAGKLIEAAHARGIRVIIDLVANHTSTAHRWFRDAITARRGSPARNRYWFRDGKGVDGAEPPNDWQSVFGGSAWTRLPPAASDPRPQWYLHLFAPEQADLNWDNLEVLAEFDNILRFWFDRGIDGMRIDVAHGFSKDPSLPDLGDRHDTQLTTEVGGINVVDHPFWDRDDTHRIFRRWRSIADGYHNTPGGPRMFVAEAWRTRAGGLTRYLRPDMLHAAFNFEYLRCPPTASVLRHVIDETLTTHRHAGAPPTWVLSTHDLMRPPSRYAAGDRWSERRAGVDVPTGDTVNGTRLSRAMALLTLALPGSAYVYQGEELGLPEVNDIPGEFRRDPIWERSGHSIVGRDGCRVPIPWTQQPERFGFTTGVPWLPMPSDWGEYAVEAQHDRPESMLTLYRRAIALRRQLLRQNPEVEWIEMGKGVVAFARTPALTVIVNLSDTDVAIDDAQILLASEPVSHRLPPGAAAWLTTPRSGIGSDARTRRRSTGVN